MQVNWIKIAVDMFGNRKIKQLESKPNSDTLIVIWLKVLTLAGRINDGGRLMLTDKEGYNSKSLAVEFGRPEKVVTQALKTFCQLEMLTKDKTVYSVRNWEKYQNVAGLDEIREQTRQRVANYRERKKAEKAGNACVTLRNVTGNATVTKEKLTKENKDLDIEKEIESKYVSINNNITSTGVSAYTCESYEEVMDGCCCTPLVKDALFRFVKHLQVNGVKIINDRLTSLIVALDMTYADDTEKVQALDEAIAKGRRRLACEEDFI